MLGQKVVRAPLTTICTTCTFDWFTVAIQLIYSCFSHYHVTTIREIQSHFCGKT